MIPAGQQEQAEQLRLVERRGQPGPQLYLLGRRWALRVLWELRDGPVGARDLRQRCDSMSSSVLYQRLRELSAAGLIDRSSDDRYTLTPVGSSLSTAIAPLDAWAQAWAQAPR